MTYRTYEEAAEELRISVNTLRSLVVRHETPVIRAGRRVLFDDRAMSELVEAMRCPSVSRSVKAVPSGGSPGRSGASAYEKALALIAATSPKIRRAARENEIYRGRPTARPR
jgi:excisionase family DNA binding protein